MPFDFKKNLPPFVKNILFRFYDKWGAEIVLDKKIVRMLSEYCKLTAEEVICMFKLAIKLDAYLWNVLNPKTKEEIENFYKITSFNIFTLAYWHMSRYQRRFRKRVLNLCNGDVLDFGGGIGDMCIELKKKGIKNVTYADVGGKNFEFAAYMFRKNNHKIPMINLSKEKVDGRYDTILCIDVIEHLTNPKETLKEMVDRLNKNGILVITGLDCRGKSETHPWHFRGEPDVERYLNSIGMMKSKDIEILWTKNQNV